MVVLDSWEVHHDNVAGANVVVGVPDIDRTLTLQFRGPAGESLGGLTLDEMYGKQRGPILVHCDKRGPNRQQPRSERKNRGNLPNGQSIVVSDFSRLWDPALRLKRSPTTDPRLQPAM